MVHNETFMGAMLKKRFLLGALSALGLNAAAPSLAAAQAVGVHSFTEGTPMQGPQQAPPPPPGSSDNSMGQQILQALQSLLGGGNEVAGVNRAEMNDASWSGSALDGAPGGTGAFGKNLINVNGCTAGPGKFKLVYSEDNSCSSVKMSEDLYEMMNTHWNRCVSYAARTHISGGVITHKGIMGDARHQAGGRSLHNHGLAIDVASVAIPGRPPFVYANKSAANREFFGRLRACWSEAARSARGNCNLGRTRSGHIGSIGDEDSSHFGHLHLSLPYCPGTVRGMNVAQLLLPQAHAQEDDHAWERANDPSPASQRNHPPPTTKTHRFKIDPDRSAEVVVTDHHGEPLGASITIEIKELCAARSSSLKRLEVCAYDDAKALATKSAVRVLYRTSSMREGLVACAKRHRVDIPICENPTPTKKPTKSNK
jgi:hypothetical protein